MSSTTASSTDRIERQIMLKASKSRVWKALTNTEEFGSWFGVELTGQTFVPGQHVRGRMNSNGCDRGADVQFDALVVEMQTERLFSYRWHPYSVDPAVDYSKEERTLVVMELIEVNGGTLLKVVESGFDKVPASRRVEALKMHSGGWEAQLKNIERYVDHG